MALSDVQIRKLQPKEKPYMLRDEDGLYLEVVPGGGKYWRLRFWSEGKERKKSLGVYPEVSLKNARERRNEAKALLTKGIDPFRNGIGSANTFENVAREWLDKQVVPVRAKNHTRTVVSRLQRLVFPYIGAKEISDVTASDLLDLLRRIEDRGAFETAHRTLQICGQVFRYGIASGRANVDPSGALRGALMPVNERHHPTITEPEQIGALLRAIDGLNGGEVVKAALKLAALTFVRPGELRHAEWNEIDLDAAEWRIPPEKMKMRKLHVVPLSRQAVSVFREIRQLTGSSRYVFPTVRSFDRPMSDGTVLAALRRMGYSQDEMTGHGFRSMASTLLNENGWPADAIERQLAHVERDGVRAAYNYAEHLEVRRKMMQWWADYLEALRKARSAGEGMP